MVCCKVISTVGKKKTEARKENFQTVSLVFRQVFEHRVQRKFENLGIYLIQKGC